MRLAPRTEVAQVCLVCLPGILGFGVGGIHSDPRLRLLQKCVVFGCLDVGQIAVIHAGLLGPPTKFTTLSPKNTSESVW